MDYKKEVDRLQRSIKRLQHNPAFRVEINTLSEAVTPMEE